MTWPCCRGKTCPGSSGLASAPTPGSSALPSGVSARRRARRGQAGRGGAVGCGTVPARSLGDRRRALVVTPAGRRSGWWRPPVTGSPTSAAARPRWCRPRSGGGRSFPDSSTCTCTAAAARSVTRGGDAAGVEFHLTRVRRRRCSTVSPPRWWSSRRPPHRIAGFLDPSLQCRRRIAGIHAEGRSCRRPAAELGPGGDRRPRAAR